MLISVVMANYNGDKYIEYAIKSVLDQEESDFEFIIIDDASTDKSKEIIEKYYILDKDRIKFFSQSENSGQGMCLNLGISEAKGDIVCFLDSDDIWFKDKLKNVKKVFSISSNIAFHQHNLLVMRDTEITKKVSKKF